MRVAIIHDWLTGMRGGEKCLEVFCELFPDADLYTLVHIKGRLSQSIEKMHIKTSFLQNMPNIENNYRYYLPVMPFAVKQFNFKGYDLILSSSHCVAKGVNVPARAKHICYCYTPMRYIWDMYGQYFGNAKISTKIAMKIFRKYLQNWDVRTSSGVDYFMAISNYVKERIKRIYNRESTVVYPPVDTEFFTPASVGEKVSKPYYLVVSAFAPYKKVDLAIKAFNIMGHSLKVIGSGQDEEYLKKIAGKNIEFLGWVNGEELRESYRNCKAVVFPSEEDFGIVPVEAQACGRPVIAYKKGGALETVKDGETGVFFDSQDEKSIIGAVERFEKMSFNPDVLAHSALRFGRERFKSEIKSFIDEKL